MVKTYGFPLPMVCPSAADERKAVADERRALAQERKRLEKEAKHAEHDAEKAAAAAKKAEAGAESEEKKARVWMKTDPLTFPAYMFTKGVFKANHPFIEVVCGSDSKMPAFNKFSPEMRLNDAVRRAAMLACVREICRSCTLFQDPTNAEFKSSLFRNLLEFTVPSSEALNRLECDQKLFERVTGQKRKRIDAAELEGLSDQGDLFMEVGTRLSWSLNEDMELDVEDEDDVEQGLIYADKKVYVREERGDKKLVIVVEEKFKGNENASYQGGQSAIAEMGTNIARRHKSPLYVLSLSDRWKYAILHVRGMVRVKNGKIDPSSLPEFREQEKVMGFGNDPISDLDLHTMLEERTRYYQKRFSDAPNSVYPDGIYPVGRFYVSDRWRALPQDFNGGCVNCDVHLFYEGLLRILIGDRVINWDEEKLNRVRKVRRLMSEEDFELKISQLG